MLFIDLYFYSSTTKRNVLSCLIYFSHSIFRTKHIYSKLITVDFYNIKKEIQNITHTTATGARNIDKLYWNCVGIDSYTGFTYIQKQFNFFLHSLYTHTTTCGCQLQKQLYDSSDCEFHHSPPIVIRPPLHLNNRHNRTPISIHWMGIHLT